jgi:voltage-gated potassium channel
MMYGERERDMTLLMQLLAGTGMIGLTVVMHAYGLDRIIRFAPRVEKAVLRTVHGAWRPVMSGLVVVSAFMLHVAQIWLWAFLYLGLGCHPLEELQTALEFSTAIYTTVGDSAITLGPSCRMLGSVEGANGFLLFGWTTAFIFEIISQFYRREMGPLEG